MKLLMLLVFISCGQQSVEKLNSIEDDKPLDTSNTTENTLEYIDPELEFFKEKFKYLSDDYQVDFKYDLANVELVIGETVDNYSCQSNKVIISNTQWEKIHEDMNQESFEEYFYQKLENLIFGALGACTINREVNANYITITGLITVAESLTNPKGIDSFNTIYVCDSEIYRQYCAGYDNLSLKEAYHIELFTGEINRFFENLLEYY